MEERKKLTIDALNEELKKAVVEVVIFILISAIGFFVGWTFTASPMENVEINDCKGVAQFVYEQIKTKQAMIEVPEGYSIERSETQITVSKDGYSGKIKATLKNGDLVFEYYGVISDKLNNGVAGLLISWLVFGLIVVIIEKLLY